jgi:cystathionine beta-lyase/cystathionine gamma-synthase
MFGPCYQCFSTSTLTPEEAGRKAERLAASLHEKESQSLSTLLAHAGMEKIPNAPMAPPLHLATTYTRPSDGLYRDSDSKYARMDNPTRVLLEKTIFELECVGLDVDEEIEPTTFAFSSGMMAVTSIILAHQSPVTFLVPKDLYHGVPSVLVKVFSRHNVTIRPVDMSQVSEVTDAISNAGLDSDVIVWMETPSNPLCQIVDIKAICDAVGSITSHNVTTVVDVTMASPVLTRPLEVSKGQLER